MCHCPHLDPHKNSHLPGTRQISVIQKCKASSSFVSGCLRSTAEKDLHLMEQREMFIPRGVLIPATSTSAHHVKPVTRPKTALSPLQTQPSSSWPNRLSRAIPAVAFMTALASVHGTYSHIPSQHVCAYGWLIITTFFCFSHA